MPDLLNEGAPFRADQLSDLGLSRKKLRHLLSEHEVRRVFHRVYVATAATDCRDLRIRALDLVMPPHGVLYGSTAAWTLGVDTFAPADRFLLKPACVVPHGASRCKTRGVRCVEGYIADSDVMEICGLRLTKPVRTTADLLRTLRRPYAISAADGLAHAGHITPREVTRYLKRLKGYPASFKPVSWHSSSSHDTSRRARHGRTSDYATPACPPRSHSIGSTTTRAG